ncbi:MAG: Crp/Fnr family transcriptional regulator [Chloroflexi bacterium]|nr:Crp/Fnr family transcriptional regulator [Chloroflexota bacterium]
MNDIQTSIARLQAKGWTIAALADELDLTANAVEKWKAGDRHPANRKATLALLDRLARKKRVPGRHGGENSVRRTRAAEGTRPPDSADASPPYHSMTAASRRQSPAAGAAHSPTPATSDTSKAASLRRSSLFSDLEEKHLIELSRLAAERSLKAGQFLFFEGDPTTSSYLVVSGIVKLLRHSTSGVDLITGVYGEGDMLGTTLLFVDGLHPSSAQAIVDTRVLSISRSDLIAFLHHNPELSTRILGKMLAVAGQRRQAAIARLSELASEKTECRLSRLLLALSLALGPSVPLTRREIAEMSGTTTETTARFISRLGRAGIVQSLRGRVIVVDEERLRRLAAGAAATTIPLPV